MREEFIESMLSSNEFMHLLWYALTCYCFCYCYTFLFCFRFSPLECYRCWCCCFFCCCFSSFLQWPLDLMDCWAHNYIRLISNISFVPHYIVYIQCEKKTHTMWRMTLLTAKTIVAASVPFFSFSFSISTSLFFLYVMYLYVCTCMSIVPRN